VLRLRQAPFSIESFIKNVCNDKYVLVIGNEVILNKEEFDEVNGDIQAYVLHVLNGELERDFHSLNELVASRPAVSTTDDPSGADLIRSVLLPNEEGHSLITEEDLSPELVSLLKTRLFRFVMTTTVDGNVEKIMRGIWKKDLRVANIADQDDWKRFQIEIGETVDRSDYERTVYKYDKPTLIYIFGKASWDRSQNFMKTENDAIEFIERWMNRQEPIINMLKERRVLALGCKFEDWYFRFFWYILKRDFGRLGEGEVALSLDDTNPDEKNLHRYLERKHIQVHTDARSFMRKVCDVLTPESHSPDSEKFHDLIKSSRGDGEIFLSYCGRDFILASKVFFQLAKLGYNVWFDNEKLCGGDYEADIRQAINQARVVITLLTPPVAEDLKNGETDRFYNKEWRLASQAGFGHIIPLAADGYSLRAPYHQEYERIIGGHIDGVDLMREDFSQLRKMIDHLRTR
jgi:hypothetical protein